MCIRDSLLYGFPLVTETGLKWGSRFGCLSLSAGVQNLRYENQSSELLDDIDSYMRISVAEDLRDYQPDLVLVDAREKKNFISGKYDFIEDYSKYENFREEWSNYEFVSTQNGMDIYRRRLALD